MKVVFFVSFLFQPGMIMGQLDESVLRTHFKGIQNADFRRVTEEDNREGCNSTIAYESDYYYRPSLEKPYSFLGYAISDASFYLTDDQKIESFHIWIHVDNALDFYKKMVQVYGFSSLASPFPYFFERHNFKIPTEWNPEAEIITSNIPIPTVEEYKDMSKVSWYDLSNDFTENEIVIRIYNYPKEGFSYDSDKRILQILFEEVEKIVD